MGFELTMLVVIGTNCIVSYKFNYHTIIATMVPSYDRNILQNDFFTLVNVILT